jgi:ABC-type sulfate/molybdate transport systems ATPase subunit
MTSFEIKDTEIQEVIQYSRLQGGSKHRQDDIYKALDRVIARGPIEDFAEKNNVQDISEKTIVCPYCGTNNLFNQNQLERFCTDCGTDISGGYEL